jgi:hypothetical protein
VGATPDPPVGRGATPPVASIKPSSRVTLRDRLVIDVDRAGTVFVIPREVDGDRKSVRAYRDGRLVRTIEVDGAAIGGAVARNGTTLAVHSNAEVFVVDAGIERWRAPVWGGTFARFTDDGATLVVRTGGGLIAFDAATGKRRATGCGWGFGLRSTTPAATSVLTQPVVCAEDVR